MSELTKLFEALRSASVLGKFSDALSKSILSDVPVGRHPLGFKAARITHGPQTLRLHMWTARTVSAQPGYEVHDHAFDFQAHVLLGRLKQSVYEVQADSEGPYSAYQVSYVPEGSLLRKKPGRFSLILQRHTEIATLETYRLASEKPHRVLADGRICATLVLTQNTKSEVTTFGPSDGPEELSFRRDSTGRVVWEEYQSLLQEWRDTQA